MAEPAINLRAPQAVRVFVASPKDVADERAIAFQVLKKLSEDPLIEDRVALQVAVWDKRGVPMLAGVTPQEAVVQALGRPSECDIVIVILWSRIGTTLDPQSALGAEAPGESGTLWEYRDAVKASRESGRPDVLVYYRTGDPGIQMADPEYKEKRAQWEQVQAFVAEFRNPDGTFRGGLNPYKSQTEFRRMLDRHLRYRLGRLLGPEPVAAARRRRRRDQKTIPFPGLDAFTSGQAEYFFGRGTETDEMVGRMADPEHRFLAIVGASGVGKSSIVAAGLIPRLQAGAVEGSADWRYLQFTPGALGENPMLAFAACLAGLVPERPVDLAARLAADPGTIEGTVRSLLKGAPPSAEALVFADQFEELFTHSHPEHRESFLRFMDAAMATRRVRFVATLRAEFYARCTEYAALAAWLRSGSFPLAPPGLAEALEMITGPVEEAGLVLEDGLAQRIVNEFGTDRSALPLLGFTLRQIYEARGPEGELTNRAYDSFEGLHGVIRSTAEQAFGELDTEAQKSLGAVFQELVTVDETQTVTRKRALLTTVAKSPAAAALVNKLVAVRLLVTDRGSDDAPVVSIAHEALLNHWSRLKAWIDERKDKLWLLQSVRTAAADWERQNHSDDFLWSEKRMRSVYATLEDLQPDLSALERRFLGIGDAAELLNELDDPRTKHARRAYIGDRLAEQGDTRPGVGVLADGTPDIGWCDVPGGEALMENGLVAWVDEFRIGKYPVTWGQFRAFLEDSEGFFKPVWWEGLLQASKPPLEHPSTLDNCSAEDVSWYDAVAFCRWLSARLGVEVRLPAEAEWRRAAAGDDRERRYPWGADWDSQNANTEESGLARVTAVGLYPRAVSPFGVHDLSGNLWEWCSDIYEDTDRRVGQDGPRVVMGGAWTSNGENASTLRRERELPDFRGYHDHGFRVCQAR
jgi:hypothetical protein